MQDLVKWSLKDENRAIQDALTQVGELFSIWTEVQRDLNDHIKEFKNQFDMILEGAKQLDVAKTDLQTAEQKEGKIKKELKKAAKKATAEELREMTNRLQEAEREKDIAQLEVVWTGRHSSHSLPTCVDPSEPLSFVHLVVLV